MRKRVTGEAGAEAPAAAQAAARADRQFITALHRGLEVLRAFRPDDRAGLSNGDIAERTALPNSTVSRLTYTLLETGYLSYDKPTGRYRMGVPVLGLGYACLSGMPVREAAQPHMQELADLCGEALVALGGRDARTMTYIACARAPSVISLQLGVGSRISLARSAMGRAWLAACPEDERDRMMGEIRRHTDRDIWPGLRDGIRRAVAEVADRGFYANFGGEWNPGVHAVAAPFPSPQPNGPLLAFNLGGPTGFVSTERLTRELGPRLVDLAATLTQRMRAEV